MADDLTKALLVEEVAAPRAIAEALFACVNGGVPLLQALIDSGATNPEILARYLSRSDAPVLRQVVPLPELVNRLPRGLCNRLLALPVRRDAITGTVDVALADSADPHPAAEIAFHLKAPVRVIRAPLSAIEEGLRRLRIRAREDAPMDRFLEATSRPNPGSDDGLYDSRPQSGQTERPARIPSERFTLRRDGSLPPPEPALTGAVPRSHDIPPRRGGLVVEPDSAPPPRDSLGEPYRPRLRTPPWGTPVHAPQVPPPTEPPGSGYGSEIPIPLTRKAFGPVAGGTQRPPALIDPRTSAMGEGYTIDTTDLRDVVEKTRPAGGDPRYPVGLFTQIAPRIDTVPPPTAPVISIPVSLPPQQSFIPGPPPLPGSGPFGTFAPHVPFPEMGGVLAALRNVTSRDEVLELVLTGARMLARKVALFVVKKGGYLGWVGTPEFGDRTALQSILIPLEANSIFDHAIREDVYLGPLRHDDVHAPLLRVMRSPSRDVAAIPIRVSGKTAVVILVDELGDTMIGTRRLEELARAAGEAFGRIVRTRR